MSNPVLTALAMAAKRDEECAVLQDQANEIAERIGSEEHHRKDGYLYEARAEAAQKKAENAEVWRRIAKLLAGEAST